MSQSSSSDAPWGKRCTHCHRSGVHGSSRCAINKGSCYCHGLLPAFSTLLESEMPVIEAIICFEVPVLQDDEDLYCQHCEVLFADSNSLSGLCSCKFHGYPSAPALLLQRCTYGQHWAVVVCACNCNHLSDHFQGCY